MNVPRHRRIGLADRRGSDQRDRSQKQQSRLEARVHAVEFLHVILQAAEQERAPSMNNVFVTIAPAIDALTSMY